MIHRETADQYHARKAVSAGFLWKMVSECPAQAYYDFNPDAPAPKQVRELDIGTAAHLAVLESHEFAARCSLIPADSYRTKEARDIRDQCYIDGKTPLLPADYKLVSDLSDVLRASAAAELLFGEGESEVSYTWTYELGPRWTVACKARADRITPHAIVDLKTAASASPEAFQRAMIRDGHHLRAAWYVDGYQQACRPDRDACPDLPDYLFVVVAKAPPHLVEVYQLDEHAIEMGRRLYRTALRRFRECQESGVWPGYTHKARIGLPTREEYRLAEMEADGELDY